SHAQLSMDICVGQKKPRRSGVLINYTLREPNYLSFTAIWQVFVIQARHCALPLTRGITSQSNCACIHLRVALKCTGDSLSTSIIIVTADGNSAARGVCSQANVSDRCSTCSARLNSLFKG